MAQEGKKGRTRQLRGHEKMVVWQNMDKLDEIVQKILKGIPQREFKMKSQIDSASDSIGANFVEGYYSGSLGELRERIRRVKRKGYITYDRYEEFNDCAIKTMYLIDRLIQSLKNKQQKG